MGHVGYPETAERNYEYSLRNNSEERSYNLLRGGNLSSDEERLFPALKSVTNILTKRTICPLG
jgi:hypothetical protein